MLDLGEESTRECIVRGKGGGRAYCNKLVCASSVYGSSQLCNACLLCGSDTVPTSCNSVLETKAFKALPLSFTFERKSDVVGMVLRVLSVN